MASRTDIDPEICKGCGLCIQVCPTKQLDFTGKFNSKGYNYVQSKNDNCIGCGKCYYTCPELDTIIIHRDIKKKEEKK